jgi:GNAT superfamily N-acetyltransferase
MPAGRKDTSGTYVFAPLTPDRWTDLEALFGARGACGGCWCMAWRLRPSEFRAQKGEGNRRAFKNVVKKGPPPGILAYFGKEPVGWCAVAPRAAYPRLANSKVLAPVDDRAVWSVSCLFVRKEYRRKGLSAGLISAAVELARTLGAQMVEGYPTDTKGQAQPAPFVWTGLPTAFLKAGFEEVARRSPARPIMRRALRKKR